MPKCVNPGCREWLRDVFYFCPSCGADNRVPKARSAVASHTHEFGGIKGKHCVWCGDPRDEPYSIGRRTRLWIAWCLIAFACLCALVAWILFQAVQTPDGLWGEHLGSWVQKTHTMTDENGNQMTTSYGTDAIGYLVLSALMAALFGIRMLFKLPLRVDTDTYSD